MLRIGMLAVAGLMATTAGVWAADVTVESTIDSVVVYPQGASITRAVPFTVPAGPSVLVITGIPTSIDVSSLRVAGSADAGIEIRSVESQQGKTDTTPDPERERIDDEIQALRDQRAVLEDQLSALQGQLQFIQNLIAEGPRGFGDLLGEAGGIADWANAWQAIGEGLAEVQGEIREVVNQQREIDRRIAELNGELATLTVPHVQTLEVRIEIEAAAAAAGELELSYRVGNARWVPAYDATLDTGSADIEPSIELVRRAEIFQQTGEDWDGVNLTLSTTRPAGGTQAPALYSNLLGPNSGRFDGSLGEFEARDQVMPSLAAGAPASNAPPAPVVQSQAITDFGDFRADYIIANPVTIVSGNSTRSVRLDTETMPARLFVQATPRLSEQAYLTAAFTAEDDAPVLAGAVNLFRDDAYVGTGQLPFTNPGEDVELGFGPDDQVRVTFTVVESETALAGFLTSFTTDTRVYGIAVENRHTRPIEINVTDRIPVSEDERITVERLDEMTEPTEEDVDGRRGVISWSYEYEAGESRTITNAYSVIYPTDLYIYVE